MKLRGKKLKVLYKNILKNVFSKDNFILNFQNTF